MAIALDASSASFVNPGTSLTYSHTCTGSDLILLVGVRGTSTNGSITGVTYNGVAMTEVTRVLETGGNIYIYLFYLIAPATGANDIVISSSSSALITGVSASFTGVKQSGQPDAFDTNSGASPLTTSLTSVADNCWGIMLAQDNNGTVTAGTGSTSIVQDNFNALELFRYSSNPITPAGNFSMQVTGSNTYATIIVSIAPVAAGGTVTPISTLALLGVG